MRYKDAIITVIALAASLAVLTGMTYTDPYQQAAQVESLGFDALAHDLFNGSKLACADQPAEGSAQ